MANDFTVDLASIPLAVIRTASDRWIGADKWFGKTDAVNKLAAMIRSGHITLADVRAVAFHASPRFTRQLLSLRT